MNLYKLKHKRTNQEVQAKTNTPDEALQIYCSESTFSSKLIEQPGWWKKEDVEINEVK